ncbi:hypothetical protein [Rhodosalinus halophilus]|jgi:hypothetical protein|nr:hypothetical protein [Rhodosalinus halophilus]
MMTQLASILRRAPGAVVADMAGLVALAVLLFAALNLPGIV